MSDYQLSANVRNSLDTTKIQRFAVHAGATILVGFPSGRTHIETVHEVDKDGNRRTTTREGGETADLAARLTYGDANIPPRPFLEEGLASQKDNLLSEIKKQAKEQKDTGTANWNKVGAMAVGAVQEFVRGDYYKQHSPNSRRTIEEKGSDTPLIDGGDLINSVEFVVEGKK